MACKHKYRKATEKESADYICTKCGVEAFNCGWVAALIFAPFVVLSIAMIVSLFG